MPTDLDTRAGDNFPQDGAYFGGRHAVEVRGVDGVGGRGGGEGITEVAGCEVEEGLHGGGAVAAVVDLVVVVGYHVDVGCVAKLLGGRGVGFPGKKMKKKGRVGGLGLTTVLWDPGAEGRKIEKDEEVGETGAGIHPEGLWDFWEPVYRFTHRHVQSSGTGSSLDAPLLKRGGCPCKKKRDAELYHSL